MVGLQFVATGALRMPEGMDVGAVELRGREFGGCDAGGEVSAGRARGGEISPKDGA